MEACSTMKCLFHEGWFYTIFPDQSMLIVVPICGNGKVEDISVKRINPYYHYNNKPSLWDDSYPYSTLLSDYIEAAFVLHGKLMVKVDSFDRYIKNLEQINNSIENQIHNM